MRRAMAGAEVGDDVYGEDPTVNALQERAAQMFAREAALFVPTGSMGNAVCLAVLCSPGSEVICDRLSHIYNYEMSSMAALSGLLPRVLDGPAGVPEAAQVEEAIHPAIYYLAPTSCISLENTANVAGGRVCPREKIERVLAVAAERGIPVHLDGARVFNAAVALGTEVAGLTAGIDCLMFCLSKGLGAPVGSLVVGSKDFIREARRVRKLFGGGMRQVGILAAAGIYALENNVERLRQDHENARLLACGLAELPGLEVDLQTVESNIIIFRVGPPAPEAGELSRRLRALRVVADPMGPDRMRVVTHLDVDRKQLEVALAAFNKAVKG
ncbi:MAG: aminotransferase class I/II-fold pyridoxal phosphate-dependent enzyme [Candidatus Glassbacteria bacterium]|nr:aminotransferase class I/II-fold pyridoxal phosphate-dependent enzyme [Candidatus Glassbacteria bacterium]